MAKLLNGSETLTSRTARVVEFPNNYVINGAIYDKTQISPKSLGFVNTYSNDSGTNMFVFKKTIYIGSNYIRPVSDAYIQDSEDPTITYTIFSNPTSGQRIRKFRKSADNKIDAIGEYVFPTSSYTIGTILSQDDKRIYFLSYYPVASNPDGLGFYALLKSNMTIDFSFGLGTVFTQATRVKEDSVYMYLLVRTNNTVLSVVRVDKANKSSTVIYTQNTTGSCYRTVGIATKPVDNNTFYSFKDNFDKIGVHNGIIYKYQINNSTSVTAEEVIIDYGEIFTNPVDQIIPVVNSSYGTYDLVLHNDNNKNYMSLFIYPPGETAALNHTNQWLNSRIYTFEIVDATHLKLVYYKNFLGTYVSSFEFIPGQKTTTFFVASSDMIIIFAWDNITNKFKEITNFSINCAIVGVDELNDVWILDKVSNVELLSSALPTNFYARFEQESYYFDGDDIMSNVYLLTENYLGNKVSCNVELFLTGDIVFAENETSIIRKSTSSTGELAVPIIVRGKGAGTINMRLV